MQSRIIIYQTTINKKNILIIFVILCEHIFGWVVQKFGWVIQNNWVSWEKTWNCPWQHSQLFALHCILKYPEHFIQWVLIYKYTNINIIILTWEFIVNSIVSFLRGTYALREANVKKTTTRTINCIVCYSMTWKHNSDKSKYIS